MKFKYYLRGIGLGIIFTSIIMLVAYTQNKGLTTDSEVVKRAMELGMVMPETEGEDLLQTQDTEDSGTEIQGEIQQQPESQPQSQPIDTQPSESQKAQNSQQAEAQSQTQSSQPSESQSSQQTGEQTQDQESEYIVIEVVPGEVCRQISEDLHAHGLVDDSESFRKYMQTQGYDNFIRVGKFPIRKGASYEEIAICLTTKQ